MDNIYEAKEWTNLWWDEADKDEGLPRILLVGDSQTFGYYPEVIRNMEKEARITALTTSKNVDNPYLIPELDLVIRQFDLRYDLIHFNNGLHGQHQTDADDFANDYEKVITHILKNYPDAALTLALCPPCYQGEHFEEPHEVLYQMAEARNARIRAIGEKYGLAVDDLFTPMLAHRDLHVPDGIHYGDEGRALLGKIVSGFLREHLK